MMEVGTPVGDGDEFPRAKASGQRACEEIERVLGEASKLGTFDSQSAKSRIKILVPALLRECASTEIGPIRFLHTLQRDRPLLRLRSA